ncbi:hypothetical protein [Saccharothrix sp. NRRL B-16348]|uniref:hypothetical protein n=1 Tax=Saccharothrix sp. NRRL B-16348 TaxID=1415542 RepID=UPI0012F7F63C|nr:hypothetical protein [Saccharothrix sp. NRRL B-16348]
MWDRLEHAQGPATDLADLLAQVRADDWDAATLYALEQRLVGDAVHSAAPVVVPLLLDVVEDPALPDTGLMVWLIGRIAWVARTARPEAIDPAWPDAWERALPRLLALTDHDDSYVRAWVPSALAAAVDQADLVWPVLRDRVPVEPDAEVAAALVLAAGWLGVPQARDWFAGLLDADAVVVRMAAVLGLRHLGVPIEEAQLPLLVEGFVKSFELDTVWCVSGRRTTGVPGLARELGDDVPTLRKILVSVIGLDDVLLRYHVMMQSVDVLHPSMLPAIAAWLTDPDPPNRFVAGYLPAAAGTDAAPYADDIATRLTDWPPSAHAAMVALAVLGDERAVEPLVRWLPEGRTTLVMAEGDFWTPPPLEEVLIGMRAHADALLPAVRERLDKSADEAESAAFRRVVEAWQAPQRQ